MTKGQHMHAVAGKPYAVSNAVPWDALLTNVTVHRDDVDRKNVGPLSDIVPLLPCISCYDSFIVFKPSREIDFCNACKEYCCSTFIS